LIFYLRTMLGERVSSSSLPDVRRASGGFERALRSTHHLLAGMLESIGVPLAGRAGSRLAGSFLDRHVGLEVELGRAGCRRGQRWLRSEVRVHVA
jgi:hypothetical protein